MTYPISWKKKRFCNLLIWNLPAGFDMNKECLTPCIPSFPGHLVVSKNDLSHFLLESLIVSKSYTLGAH